MVLGSGGLVKRGHAVFGPEVQVSASIFQHFNQLHTVVEVGGEGQRALWKKGTLA